MLRKVLFVAAVLTAAGSAGCGREAVECRPASVAPCRAPDGGAEEDDGGVDEAECDDGLVTDCAAVIVTPKLGVVVVDCVARCLETGA